MDRLTVAIVGSGFIAQERHIPSFQRLRKKTLLCAVCDLNKPLAKRVANKFGIRKVYSDFSKLLSSEEPDIIDVCTPPSSHALVALEAMESGCHVLLEKPMAQDLPSCDKMIRTSQRCREKLSVVHNQRFYSPFLESQRLVETGDIGELTGMRILSSTSAQTYLVHKDHWIHKLHGGLIGETGPHVVYMSLPFIGSVKKASVYASKNTDYPWVAFDGYRIELEGEKTDSSIYVSHANNVSVCEVDLFGTNYALRMDLGSMLLIRYRERPLTPVSVGISSLNVTGQILKGVISNSLKVMLRRPMLGHPIMIERFVDSVAENRPVPVPPEEGRETVRVMEMIIKSLETCRSSTQITG